MNYIENIQINYYEWKLLYKAIRITRRCSDMDMFKKIELYRIPLYYGERETIRQICLNQNLFKKEELVDLHIMILQDEFGGKLQKTWEIIRKIGKTKISWYKFMREYYIKNINKEKNENRKNS